MVNWDAWREILWKTCPLTALKTVREQMNPVIAWVAMLPELRK